MTRRRHISAWMLQPPLPSCGLHPLNDKLARPIYGDKPMPARDLNATPSPTPPHREEPCPAAKD